MLVRHTLNARVCDCCCLVLALSKCLAARHQHHSFTAHELLLQLQAVCTSRSVPFQHRHVPQMLQQCAANATALFASSYAF